MALAVIWHSRTGASKALAKAVARGAGDYGRLLPAETVQVEDMLTASGFVFVGPENLAGLSGVMKEMFDRMYYPVLGRIEGRAYATIIAAGSDGEGATRAIDRIVKGWRLRRVVEPLIVCTHAQSADAIAAIKHLEGVALEDAYQLGSALSEAFQQGIF